MSAQCAVELPSAVDALFIIEQRHLISNDVIRPACVHRTFSNSLFADIYVGSNQMMGSRQTIPGQGIISSTLHTDSQYVEYLTIRTVHTGRQAPHRRPGIFSF